MRNSSDKPRKENQTHIIWSKALSCKSCRLWDHRHHHHHHHHHHPSRVRPW